MVPRADDQLGGDAALAEVLVEQRGAALEQVELAADQEGRHGDLGDHVDRAALGVERAVVRRLVAGDRLDQRRAGEGGGSADVRGERADAGLGLGARDGRRDQAGGGDQAEPQRHEAGVDLATGGGDVAVDVGRRHLREDRLQPGGLAGGREDLADAHVRRAGHGGAAVAPLLLVGPGHHLGGVEVLALVERVPLALARAGAAGVDGELGVAALDEVVTARPGDRAAAARGLVVRRDGHHDRELGRDGVPVGVGGAGQVTAQLHAVGHRDRDVLGGHGVGVLLGAGGPRRGGRGRLGRSCQRQRRDDEGCGRGERGEQA